MNEEERMKNYYGRRLLQIQTLSSLQFFTSLLNYIIASCAYE
jgi:hypothetical protein